MVAVYAIATVLGVLGIITWVALGMIATAIPEKKSLEPEARYGVAGRTGVAAVAGLGLGGMSASYAGAGTIVAIGGAIVGAVAMGLLAGYLGFADDSEGGADSQGDSV